MMNPCESCKCNCDIPCWKIDHGLAVEVVRCRDCIYWQDNNDGYPHPECRWGHDETPDPDDYCSFGKAKMGGGE